MPMQMHFLIVHLQMTHCVLPPWLAMPHYSIDELRKPQEADEVTSKLLQACSILKPRLKGPEWDRPPLQRYHQLWSQLKIVEGVLCRHYTPDPSLDSVLVLILPTGLHHESLCRNHDAPSAGHQGTERTLHRIHQEAYWVGMARDVNRHCQTCRKCQQSKLPSPQHAPLVNIPFGRPWQMIAADILEVPISSKNNRYLLVVQGYYTSGQKPFPYQIKRQSQSHMSSSRCSPDSAYQRFYTLIKDVILKALFWLKP